VILDVRTRSQYGKDQRLIPNAIRVRPDEVEEWARTWVEEHPQSQLEGQRIVTYCT
jgi:predicted sulfurtransferase